MAYENQKQEDYDLFVLGIVLLSIVMISVLLMNKFA